MDKIKAFFQSKITKIVAWIVLALDIVVLIVGGATTAEISDGVQLVGVIVAAVVGFIAFITERVGKKSK